MERDLFNNFYAIIFKRELFMEIKELITTINKLSESIKSTFIDSIVKIIECAVEKNKLSDKEVNRKLVKKRSDLKEKGFTGSGFYMIFNDMKIEGKCKVKYDEGEYTCVYRGQAYTTEERLKSHLFYAPNGQYECCMKIKTGDKKYNIDIENKKLYEKNVEVETTDSFPDCNWLVIRIALPKSTKFVREMFEDAFDKKYGMPLYSDK